MKMANYEIKDELEEIKSGRATLYLPKDDLIMEWERFKRYMEIYIENNAVKIKAKKIDV